MKRDAILLKLISLTNALALTMLSGQSKALARDFRFYQPGGVQSTATFGGPTRNPAVARSPMKKTRPVTEAGERI